MLDQDVDVDRRAVAQEKLPEKVPLPAFQIVRNVRGVHPLQGRKIEPVDPRLLDEPTDQLLDQPGMGEQRAVAPVVVPQNLSFA
jgi:hypothetical protein